MAEASKRIGYLSGAVRVTTRPDTDASGPRAHVVGFTSALERCGWDVRRFIAGDAAAAQRLAAPGRADAVRGSRVKQAATDALRIVAGMRNRRAASHALGADLDLVYERFASFQSLGRPFQRAGVPWILETQGPYFQEAVAERNAMALPGLARRLELDAYRSCDLLVCVSDPLRDLLVDLGVPSDRTFVLRNGVDACAFLPPTPSNGPLTVGFVGTLRRWQGVVTLVDGVALARARGLDVRAVVVGDGPELDPLRSRAGDGVTFTGRVPSTEIPELIATFDLGFSGHLPLYDGRTMYHSPLKLYEYLAAGKPLVAADHPEARSLVEESGSGWLFPAGDAGALAEVLGTIDPDAVRAAGPEVRRVAIERHSWEARVRALESELSGRGLLP